MRMKREIDVPVRRSIIDLCELPPGNSRSSAAPRASVPWGHRSACAKCAATLRPASPDRELLELAPPVVLTSGGNGLTLRKLVLPRFFGLARAATRAISIKSVNRIACCDIAIAPLCSQFLLRPASTRRSAPVRTVSQCRFLLARGLHAQSQQPRSSASYCSSC